ncbi:hypothetical protein GCM10027063_21950 [Promicromonospora xylanilytica]
MALVEVHDVSYQYPNGFIAVDGVSFSVEAGDSVAIIGQNGAGKTTTVKMINGLTKPTRGVVKIGGADTATRTAAQTSSRVGYVFQNPDDQIFNATVAEEVGYALRRRKVARQERDLRVERACEMTGLAGAMEANPYDLPLSTRKFVTIAAVIAADPDVVILDEPTAGQDLRGLNLLTQIVCRLQDAGKAVLTISHDMDFVAQNFDRLIVMANKRVVRDAPTDEIFYDDGVMAAASLKAPGLVDLAKAVGSPEVGLDIDRLNAVIRERSSV